MKVRFQGFSFSAGKKISDEEYVKLLTQECDGGDFTLGGKKRIFHCSATAHKDYYAGVLITIKNHKTFARLKNNKKIIVSEAGDGESLMEFNYFVIHKRSFRGMYQHYHHSCNLNQFGIFLRDRYEGLIDIKIKELTKGKPPSEELEKQKSKLVTDFGEFTISIMVRKENLKKLLMKLSRIAAFDFDIHTVDVREREFTPAPDFAKKVHKHVIFERKASLTTLVAGIEDFISKQDIQEGRVKGYDANGLETIIGIAENPDFFAEHDFDIVARNIKNTDIDDLKNNWVIKQLIKKADDNSFGTVTK
jgi:hypothetical protein